jgi:hypothetical protein
LQRLQTLRDKYENKYDDITRLLTNIGNDDFAEATSEAASAISWATEEQPNVRRLLAPYFRRMGAEIEQFNGWRQGRRRKLTELRRAIAEQ